MTHLPISEACERNKAPILEVLRRVFLETHAVLEIGSGTGQHALYFAENLSHINWQSSDFGRYLPALRERLGMAPKNNLASPIELDVRNGVIPRGEFDAVFSANTLHIMSETAVKDFFHLVGKILPTGGLLLVYGPFKYGEKFTSESNARFDLHLRTENIDSAIRDFEWVDELAKAEGMTLQEDISMPSNNQCLVWRKS